MNSGQLVIAYHGCDITLRDDLVSGRIKTLSHSKNKYDWLGAGAYFFENDMARALLFAENSHKNPDKRYTAKPIATPAVVGAVLSISRCLDMTTQDGIREYLTALDPLVDALTTKGLKIPTNHAASDEDEDVILRELDRAVFDFIHERRSTQSELESFQAVRGAFQQGKKLAHNSGFQENTHIQIALRHSPCVLGWFLPPNVELLEPQQLLEARKRLSAMNLSKPRIRAKTPTAKSSAPH